MSANGRGRDGRFQRGNTAAVVHEAHSAQRWARQAPLRRTLAVGMLLDRGFAEADAPLALAAAVDGAAQAILMRDSAFERIVEMGGPSTLRGRPRAAFTVWLAASDRAEKLLRLVGLARVPKAVDPLEDVRRAVEAANREDDRE